MTSFKSSSDPQANGVSSGPSCTPMVDPIAVVGLAGRFPGEATSAMKLWDMCCQGESAWSEVPKDRFNSEAYFHPNPAKSGCFNSKGAHFLKNDVALFDALFFGISPSEAKAMDPQQRLLLETTYEALENAGITLDSISGSQTGVYVGAAQIDYGALLNKDVDDIPVYQSTGTSANILSNRISYVFNLKGTSITMDTACSSSLAALHIACQSMRTGENEQAVVCGSHIMLSPDTMVGMSMLRLFGEEGISYTYDSRGTGYGRGEGVVSVILKPLNHAIRDGDNIRAIIRNTGANSDGKTPGITFPSCEAQAKLMRSVYELAGLDPVETDYVEAHGTGTAAGDPVEAEAISRVFAENRSIDRPVYVGSVKTNIGHLEAGSGLAAMVKTIFALEEGIIPPNINFEQPNKDIPLEKWKLKVPTSLTAWPSSHVRRASISNFGFGGTNVHVILEQHKPKENKTKHQTNGYAHANGISRASVGNTSTSQAYDTDGIRRPPETSRLDSTTHGSLDIGKDHISNLGLFKATNSIGEFVDLESRRRRLFILSANDKATLKTQMLDLASYLNQKSKVGDDELLESLAFTLCHRRTLLEWREAVSASTVSELSNALSSKDGEPTRPSGTPTLGFVFTGQGAQWYAMGRELLQYPIFATALQEADQALETLGADWSLLDELSKDVKSSLVDRPYISQPATTAIQIALVQLFSSWGIAPTNVVGHSSGEIAAAYAAGGLSLEDCMLVAYKRGILAETLKKKRPERPGGMLAIGASPAKVRPMVKRLGSAHVVIACVNGPSLVTTSGDVDAISELQGNAEDEGLLNRRLKVDVAYHSPHMRDIADEYLAAIEAAKPMKRGHVNFHSSVKGRQLETEKLNADYWAENMIKPVQFVDAVQSIYDIGKGPDVLIEIGPHCTLKGSIKDIIKSNPGWPSIRYFSSLVRGEDASLTSLSLASALHVLGCKLDLSAINNSRSFSRPQPLSDLPSYPWNNKRHWHESRLSINHRLRRFPRSDILGNLVDDFNEIEPRWRNILRLTDIPWLLDHRVQGSTVFPLTGYLAMAIEGASQYGALKEIPINTSTQYKLREIRISQSMVLSEEAPTETSMVMRPREEGSKNSSKTWMEFTIYSWISEGGWREHCHGLISLREVDREPNPVNGHRQMAAWKDNFEQFLEKHESVCNLSLNPADIYSRFSRGGLEFGPAFQNITAAKASTDHSIGTICVPDTAKLMPNEFQSALLIHPVTFDACFQVIDFAAGGGDLSRLDIHVPTFVKEITVNHTMPNTPGNKLRVYATRERPFGDLDSDVHGSFVATDASDENHVVLDVKGLVCSKLPSQNIDDGQPSDRELCYQMQWEPCIDLMTREQYDNSFAINSNAEIATRQVHDLERASFYYVESAFEALSREQINVPQTHLIDLHKVLSGRLALGHQGNLPFQTSEWLGCAGEEKKRFLAHLASSDDCGRLVCSMGENLVSVFGEEVEPLSIMLRDNMLQNFYRSHELSKSGYESSARVVEKLAHQNPHMRIIEIGAGTGGATMPLLRALGSKFSHFDFTDISTGFFEKARDEQKKWGDKISYRKLNVEEDPVGQGFQPESYDLVFAANVLHATSNVTRTMANVRRLLRPGGKALIGEITTQLTSSALIFGTLPGWWLGEEPERQDGPFLTETAWDKVYRKTGFSGLDGSVQIRGSGPSIASVMLTTAISEQVPTYPEISIVVCKEVDENLLRTVHSSMHGLIAQQASVQGLLEADLTDRHAVVLALEDPFLSEADEGALKRMQYVFSSARGVLWVTRGASSQNPEANMITGFARSLRAENAGLHFVTLDLDEEQRLSNDRTADTILRVLQLTFVSDSPSFVADTEFLEVKGVLQVPRVVGNRAKDQYVVRETHRPVPEPQPFVQEGRPLKLKLGQAGLLDSLHFEDDLTLQRELGKEEIEISVKFTGMNFKDVMIGLGQIPFYHELGIECCGIVRRVGSSVRDIRLGNRVCAFTTGAYANVVRVSQHLVARIPVSMGFAQAASLPVVFCTAHYALSDVGRLSKGDSILIHAAAGGVGQAAIMLAQEAGANIFVTVGSLEKKTLMMDTYGIPEDHIFSSRDATFHQELMAKTKTGVDVVLNSTAGEVLRQSWQCLAPLGRFIEIGKRDIILNSNLEMEKFTDSVSFAAVDLGVLSIAKPLLLKRVLTDVMNMYENNIIRPVTPITVYSISELQQAIRLMQSGKHMGKVIIEGGSDCVVQALPRPLPRLFQDDAASYIITGGTGGLGRSISRWMARQGAKHIILASRSGSSQKGVAELIEELSALEVQIIVRKCDIADCAQVQQMVSDCQASMPPIKGVIHGAMALRDTLFEKIAFEDWQLNIKPRVQGAWNLHHCLLAANADLNFFLSLASGSGITGNPGQAAYAASNTFLDAFAKYRTALGLPASVIDIGIVDGVGYVAENKDREAQIATAAHDRLTEDELLALVGAAISGAFNAGGAQLGTQTLTGFKLYPGRPLPLWAADPKFSHLLLDLQSSASDTARDDRAVAVRTLLKKAESAEAVMELVREALRRKLASLLTIAAEDVDLRKPVVAYGLDSLVAIELRNWIGGELDAGVPLMELMNSASIEALAGKIAGKSKSVDQGLFAKEGGEKE